MLCAQACQRKEEAYCDRNAGKSMMSCGTPFTGIPSLATGDNPFPSRGVTPTAPSGPVIQKPAAAVPNGPVHSSSVTTPAGPTRTVSVPTTPGVVTNPVDPDPPVSTITVTSGTVSRPSATGPVTVTQAVTQPAAPLPPGSCTFCTPVDQPSTPVQPGDPVPSIPGPVDVTPQAPSVPGNTPQMPQTPGNSPIQCTGAACTTQPPPVAAPGAVPVVGPPGAAPVPALPGPGPAALPSGPLSSPPAGEQHHLHGRLHACIN